MKRFILILFTLAFGCATAVASVNVTNLYLEKSSQFTEFSIECDQNFEYSHQIVEATADRPYRIVVDIQDANHRLPQNTYENLPAHSIERIRTSQYSIEPVKTVRVVLDVDGVLTYKVKKDKNRLSLLINTPKDSNFPIWSAVPGSSPVYVSEPAKPEPMPARPGNEVNTPKVDKTQPTNKDLKLVEKPAKPAATEQKHVDIAPPEMTERDIEAFADVFMGEQAPAEPVLAEAARPEPPTQKDAESVKNVATPAPVTQQKVSNTPKQAETGKRVDTAVAPPQKAEPPMSPQQQTPGGIKPPKAEKTALPETKAVARPTLATSEVNKATEKKTAATETTVARQESEKVSEPAKETTEPAEAPKTKPQAVHEKYLARQETGRAPAAETRADEYGLYGDEASMDKVEKIRQKYRRGISFVTNDEDAHRLAQARQETSEQAPQMAIPYDEYVPHREVVIYNSGGRRDPFAPLIDDAQRAAERSDLPDVRSLRLIGVLQDTEGNRALFEDYNGFAYILQTGDRVKNGFLVTVAEDHAVFQIRQYGWTRTVALELEEEN